MRNWISFSLMLLSLIIYSRSTTKVQLLAPSKPTLQEELIIQNIEAAVPKLEFECSADEEDLEFPTRENPNNLVQDIPTWNDGFYLQIDSAFSGEELIVINGALYELSRHLCIPIYLWPSKSIPTGDFVRIFKDIETIKCSSSLGKRGGEQVINLGVGCVIKYKIIHECLHALGLSHEHKRMDRDSYITIDWDNIIAGKWKQFTKSKYAMTLGVAYDTASIMHYQSYHFAKNTNKPTIITKNGGIIPVNDAISASDKLKLHKLFQCN